MANSKRNSDSPWKARIHRNIINLGLLPWCYKSVFVTGNKVLGVSPSPAPYYLWRDLTSDVFIDYVSWLIHYCLEVMIVGPIACRTNSYLGSMH